MWENPWLLLLIVVAIAIGWLLGRRGQLFSDDGPAAQSLSQQYYKGLNYLLNDQPDGALDSFIEALEVNSETLETHLAVGNLMRRKGEVERAIGIHQNLLARPSLEPAYLHQAHLELARDYISAGLFDRAEGLLLELAVESVELQATARQHLLEIYQNERDWSRAVATAQQLLPKKFLLKTVSEDPYSVMRPLAHFYCELAEQQLVNHDVRQARVHLKDALNYDRNCVRASLLLGRIESETEHFAQAIKAYRKVLQQDSHFIPEIIQPLKYCYQQLGKEQEYYQFLADCVENYPSSAVLLAFIAWTREQQGDEAAAEFIAQQLERRPSLRGLSSLVELHLANSSGRAKDNLALLQSLIGQLLKDKPSHRCKHCGFSGRQLHWQCPSCKQWGGVEYIRGAEGD